MVGKIQEKPTPIHTISEVSAGLHTFAQNLYSNQWIGKESETIKIIFNLFYLFIISDLCGDLVHNFQKRYIK